MSSAILRLTEVIAEIAQNEVLLKSNINAIGVSVQHIAITHYGGPALLRLATHLLLYNKIVLYLNWSISTLGILYFRQTRKSAEHISGKAIGPIWHRLMK